LSRLLRGAGIEVRLHYDRAAHQHSAFAGLPALTRPSGLPESEAWAREELSLPMFAELSDAELHRIAFVCRTACISLAAPRDGVAAGRRSYGDGVAALSTTGAADA